MRWFNIIIERFSRIIFELGQKIGFNILPKVRFYSEIPDIAELKSESAWKQPRSMVGIRGVDIQSQVAFLKECCPPELTEKMKGDIYARACEANGEPGFGPIESDFLFCFIFSMRPAKIVQVGAGVATAVILSACSEAGYQPQVTCIDPFPTRFPRVASEKQQIHLILEKVQDVISSDPGILLDSDFLFVDSTHTVKPGSDVNAFVFEVLPRLNSRCYIHFHDTYFPYDYQRGLLGRDLFFHNESNLLHAYLIHNSQCSLRISLSMLHYAAPHELKKCFHHYLPQSNDAGLKSGEMTQGHFPSSVYLQVT